MYIDCLSHLDFELRKENIFEAFEILRPPYYGADFSWFHHKLIMLNSTFGKLLDVKDIGFARPTEAFSTLPPTNYEVVCSI